MLTNFDRKVVSNSVSALPGRNEASLVNRTSTGIWRRDCVTEKTFSGERVGSVRIRKNSDAETRRRMERKTAGGTGWTLRPWMRGAFLRERYHPMTLGRSTGPKKIRRDFTLLFVATVISRSSSL